MIKSPIIVLFIFLTIGNAQTALVVFDSSKVARASEVNNNFTFLLNKINDLQVRFDSLTKLKPSFPIGTIIASVRKPLGGGYMPGDSSWMIANGDPVIANIPYTTDYGSTSTPDLRGMFLRGLNAGRNDGKEDPQSPLRKPGDYQEDAFQSHKHEQYVTSNDNGSGPAIRQDYDADARGAYGYPQGMWTSGPVVDGGFGSPKFSNETRPKNAAVYYYIKVR